VLYVFDATGAKRRRKPRATSSATDRAGARAFYCAACITRVCADSDLISVAGARQHRFVNPAGLAFAIACFAEAACTVEGEPTLEHTWFVAHAWSVANCRNCGRQLGWFFSGPSYFYGLILDRLISGA
jgi:hypothetical protein